MISPGQIDAALLRQAAVAMARAVGVQGVPPAELMVSIENTLFGKRKYWQCFMEKLITEEELRDVVVARYQSFLEEKFSIRVKSLDYFTDDLKDLFDKALFGRPAKKQSSGAGS